MLSISKSPDTKPCPECGSDKIIRDIHLKDIGEGSGRQMLTAEVDEKPDALFFKSPVSTPVRAEACGDCGYIRSFLEDPNLLWLAYNSRSSNVE